MPWDREGRVLVTTLLAERLCVVNVYAVNGTSKPYYDHEAGGIQGDRHLFKRRLIERLTESCQALRELGLDLVLIGDWNISRAAIDTHPRLRTEEPHALAREAFNETFMPSLQLVDVYRHLHPRARAYTWFNRRTPPGRLDAARVDFALISESLLPRVKDVGILADPAMRFRSDHAPLYVEFELGGAGTGPSRGG